METQTNVNPVQTNRRTVKVIRVDANANERGGDFAKPLRLGQVFEMGYGVITRNDWVKSFYQNGLMLLEDYEKGDFAKYGYDKKVMLVKDVEVDSLKNTNIELQQKIAELEKALMEKPKKGGQDGAK